MKNKQNLNKNNKFREENEQMNKLTREDYKNIDGKLNYEHIVNNKSKIEKYLNYYENVVTEIFQL